MSWDHVMNGWMAAWMWIPTIFVITLLVLGSDSDDSRPGSIPGPEVTSVHEAILPDAGSGLREEGSSSDPDFPGRLTPLTSAEMPVTAV